LIDYIYITGDIYIEREGREKGRDYYVCEDADSDGGRRQIWGGAFLLTHSSAIRRKEK